MGSLLWMGRWLALLLLLVDPLLILQIGVGVVTEEVLGRELVHHLAVRRGGRGGANLVGTELELAV